MTFTGGAAGVAFDGAGLKGTLLLPVILFTKFIESKVAVDAFGSISGFVKLKLPNCVSLLIDSNISSIPDIFVEFVSA